MLNVETNLNFVLLKNEMEVASANDTDLMKIKCYGCHEGINENNVEFTRYVLSKSYQSFIDKPLVIATNQSQMPEGHAYNYKTKKFDKKKRKFIGHIVNAYPVIVADNGEVTDVSYYSDEELQKNAPDGEYRIVCELVVYKQYEKELCDILSLLHVNNNLKFSMESLCDIVEDNSGIRHCSSIHFTALTIVKSPAFINSISLEIAEKGEKSVDFEKLYNDLLVEVTSIKVENSTLVSDKTNLETELADIREELVDVNATVKEKDVEIASLSVYKEKVENAEKLALGQERLDKLSKYGYKEKTAEELAEVEVAEYLDILEGALENYVPNEDVVAGKIEGVFVSETSKKSNKDKLSEILTKTLANK